MTRTAIQHRLVVPALLLACTHLATSAASAQETLYFADIFNPSFDNGYLRKVDTDGSGLQTLVNVGGGLRGVAVDPYAGKVYWTDVENDVIRRANLNGSGAEDLVTEGLEFPMAIDLDLLRGKIYWGDQTADLISCANLDGSGVTPIVATNFSSGLAVDPIAGKIYWSATLDVPPWDSGEIMRANLDGTNVEVVVTGAGKPADIALDAVGGKVYWTDYAHDVVGRADLDGTHVETLYTVGENLNPGGIAIDRSAGKVYWGQVVAHSPYVGKIMRMNLDGTDQEDATIDLGLVTDMAIPARLVGDLNHDGVVDQIDFGLLADCLAGPSVTAGPECVPADLNADGAVDLADFRVFQLAFTG